MEHYDKGSAIVIEVEFKQHTPFGVEAYFDPTSPTVTVTDTEGTDKIDGEALIRSDTGKWYYVCQSLVAWITGIYSVKVVASDGTYGDVTVEPEGFILE
jgi:hypothetical protein